MCIRDDLIHFFLASNRSKLRRWTLRALASGRRRSWNVGHAERFPLGKPWIRLRDNLANRGLQWLPNSVPTRTCLKLNDASGRSFSTRHPLRVLVRVYLSRATEAGGFLAFVPSDQLQRAISVVGYFEPQKGDASSVFAGCSWQFTDRRVSGVERKLFFMLHSDLLLDGDGWMRADEKSIKVFSLTEHKTRQFNEILIVMKISSLFFCISNKTFS